MNTPSWRRRAITPSSIETSSLRENTDIDNLSDPDITNNYVAIETPEETRPHRAASSASTRVYSYYCRCFKRYQAPPQQRIITTQMDLKMTKKLYPGNKIKNSKYNTLTFIPLNLWNQFKHFSNLYFLWVSVSQLIPALRTSFIFTSLAPLIFVLLVTMSREAFDDIQRHRRDDQYNKRLVKMAGNTVRYKCSKDLLPGDLILLEKGDLVPADCLILSTSEPNHDCFIKSDQLDGETDYKFRQACPIVNSMSVHELLHADIYFTVEPPRQDIYAFKGTVAQGNETYGIDLVNTMWANTSVASGKVVAIVIYTGPDTRARMGTEKSRVKVSRMDKELNLASKVMFFFLFLLSIALAAANTTIGFSIVTLGRFLTLLSAIIPISMKVTIDIARSLYTTSIARDRLLAGSVLKNSSLPEEMGRVKRLFSDKTGTLTKNKMTLFKIALPHEVVTAAWLKKHVSQEADLALLMMSLCHSVSPSPSGYQASSPDEIALVEFAADTNFDLVYRDVNKIELDNKGVKETWNILDYFPFTSADKKMTIVLEKDGDIFMMTKGADSVILPTCVGDTSWTLEAVDFFSREGLRTLVFAIRKLTANEWTHYSTNLRAARTSMNDRDRAVHKVRQELEAGAAAVCVSGVEDVLMDNVKTALEKIRDAGISITLCTGDKLETALCIARSARLVAPEQDFYILRGATHQELNEELSRYVNNTKVHKNCALVVQGDQLHTLLADIVVTKPSKKLAVINHIVGYVGRSQCGPRSLGSGLGELFINALSLSSACIICRCSPLQKALCVKYTKIYTGDITAAIGDASNDVSMINESDIGFGIKGVEGNQAALAADVALEGQFHFIVDCLLWHGRNAYTQTSSVTQFIISRGLCVSIIQAIYSALWHFTPISFYNGWLLALFSTAYSMFPAFCMTLDRPVPRVQCMKYPEIYRRLTKGREFNSRSVLNWFLLSIYQGSSIIITTILLSRVNF